MLGELSTGGDATVTADGNAVCGEDKGCSSDNG
jgi:hypothetical protein